MHIGKLGPHGTFLFGENMEIKVNGVTLYYEKKGFGKPLIMLHGNGESHEIFDVLSEPLKKDFEVYLIDSRCHGKSEKHVEISYELMAEDMRSFIKVLSIEKPMLFGFSDGGITGLLLAIKDKNLLGGLMIAGANYTKDGFTMEALKEMQTYYQKTQDPLYKMMLHEPNITHDALESIQTKTYIFVGSDDMIKLSHTKSLHAHIKDSKLNILKGHNHYDYVVHNDVLKTYIIKYLKK